MTQERPRIQDESDQKDYFIDRFDSYTRRKILGVAASFGSDFERMIFMAHKSKDADRMTEGEVLSIVPEELKKQDKK